MAEPRNKTHDSIGVRQFGYLGIGVSDMSKWKTFSGATLGFQDNGTSDSGGTWLRWDDYHHRIELLPSGEDDIVYHGWEVKDAAALEAVASRIEAFGIKVRRGNAEDAKKRMVVDLISFTDPDGIPAEIYFGPLIDHKPFVSPRVVSGFKAGNLGLGHMVLAVEDPDAYVRFMTTALGAKVSDYIEMSVGPMTIHLTFLHVNPRHHSVAVTRRMKIPGAPPQKRLHHIMVELNSIDDVGYAHSLFRKQAIPVGDLGRHTNDRMLSFYGDTPSGFQIEYGCGAIMIENEDNWEIQRHLAPSIWGHGMPPRDRPA